jgi:phosphoesterase RecJ-like protein
LITFDDIDNAKHIVIMADNDSFANANALYSFVLSMHKKVSLVASEKIDTKFSFLPWFHKVKERLPASADLTIESNADTITLYKALKKSPVTINQKMATALFAGLLESSEGFLSNACDELTFAVASELIALKAQHVTCKEFLQKRESLALFRLKSLLNKKMLQSSNGEVVHLYITDKDLKSAGATQKDVYKIQKEVLTMVHVKEVILYKSDENNKILKSIKEI